MRLILDDAEGKPVYRQIADEFEREIATGVLRTGDALPALRVLALDLRVNPNTVQQAYRLLGLRGLAEVRRGRGTFVKGMREANAPARAAREIANKALRETYRHGLLARDLVRAIQELAPETRA
ncbi:MAG: GntR family transcriptional regulator [Acidobacteriota bacterium]|nr:GntR family transcriptional regulator [Acidobacteriota bacterium]